VLSVVGEFKNKKRIARVDKSLLGIEASHWPISMTDRDVASSAKVFTVSQQQKNQFFGRGRPAALFSAQNRIVCRKR
jgi:hypothetical protein